MLHYCARVATAALIKVGIDSISLRSNVLVKVLKAQMFALIYQIILEIEHVFGGIEQTHTSEKASQYLCNPNSDRLP